MSYAINSSPNAALLCELQSKIDSFGPPREVDGRRDAFILQKFEETTTKIVELAESLNAEFASCHRRLDILIERLK